MTASDRFDAHLVIFFAFGSADLFCNTFLFSSRLLKSVASDVASALLFAILQNTLCIEIYTSLIALV
jgi:hypothetical protein